MPRTCRILFSHFRAWSVVAATRRPPPARPPVLSQTIQSEMSHRQERASPGMLGSERGGQERRDRGAGPPPNPHSACPCSRTLLPANRSQAVCAKPIHPLPPSLYPHSICRHMWGEEGGHLLTGTPESQLLCLDDPSKNTQAEGLTPPVLSPAVIKDFTEKVS